jgi:hypothetical protein
MNICVCVVVAAGPLRVTLTGVADIGPTLGLPVTVDTVILSVPKIEMATDLLLSHIVYRCGFPTGSTYNVTVGDLTRTMTFSADMMLTSHPTTLFHFPPGTVGYATTLNNEVDHLTAYISSHPGSAPRALVDLENAPTANNMVKAVNYVRSVLGGLPTHDDVRVRRIVEMYRANRV